MDEFARLPAYGVEVSLRPLFINISNIKNYSMNLVQKFGIAATSGAVLTALAFAPIIASADNDKNKGENNRPASQRVEVAIADSGNVLVRGAKVTAVSGSTITVTTTAGAS